MQVFPLELVSRKLSIAAITGYQKCISPHKGFVCAHRILYHSESCSQYIKRIIAQEGFEVALKKSRQRFQECKRANQILRYQHQNLQRMSVDSSEEDIGIELPEEKSLSKKQRRKSNHCQSDQCSDCGNFADCSNCGDYGDIFTCGDCNLPECGDCGNLDCGDCGSCGGN